MDDKLIRIKLDIKSFRLIRVNFNIIFLKIVSIWLFISLKKIFFLKIQNGRKFQYGWFFTKISRYFGRETCEWDMLIFGYVMLVRCSIEHKLLPAVKTQNGGWIQDGVEKVLIFTQYFDKWFLFFNFSFV
jgi:hypothetical protein